VVSNRVVEVWFGLVLWPPQVNHESNINPLRALKGTSNQNWLNWFYKVQSKVQKVQTCFNWWMKWAHCLTLPAISCHIHTCPNLCLHHPLFACCHCLRSPASIHSCHCVFMSFIAAQSCLLICAHDLEFTMAGIVLIFNFAPIVHLLLELPGLSKQQLMIRFAHLASIGSYFANE
jgi:hypothetical protein